MHAAQQHPANLTMPELPEVETTCRGIAPHLVNQTIKQVITRTPKLRWPIPKNLDQLLAGSKIVSTKRRAKYIIIHFTPDSRLPTPDSFLLIHLGMTGSLRILTESIEPTKHDHFDLSLNNGTTLRYRDPRKFGAILWTNEDPSRHPLLAKLGPEPLSRQFTAKYLLSAIQTRNTPIKQCIMDNHIVVGVGNIYANESCFLASIHPLQPAKTLSEKQCQDLVKAIKQILRRAIKAGGTTLQDFVNSEGKPGYFKQQLNVYGREGEACYQCGTTLQREVLGQRATVFCQKCQA